MNLFQSGNFKLASGQETSYKIECDSLCMQDWETLAYLLANRVGSFGWAIGIPKGGMALASAMQQYRTALSPVTLFVDDVWTTGSSMNTYIDTFSALKDKPIKRAVAFARTPAPDVTVLFQLSTCYWGINE